MPNDLKIRPASVKREAFRVRRAGRFDAQLVLWNDSTLPRVRACGRRVASSEANAVQLRVSIADDGTRTGGFGNLQTCGSPWSCPSCATKIAASRQRDLSAALAGWQAMGRGVVMVTVTMRHKRGQRLKTLWDAQSYAWHAATSGRGWAADQKGLGVLMDRTIKTGQRAGETVTETRIPTVRVVEVTHGKNGWHVHVHALLFLRAPVMDATADELGRNIFARWSAALERKGLAAPVLHLGGMEAHAGEGDVTAFADYFTKAQFDSAGLAAEATRADIKGARLGNRTPFEVLHSVWKGGDVDDLAVWHEWEAGSFGRRQIQWSPGLRELVALPVVEQSDDDIAAEDIGGMTVAYLDPAAFTRLVAYVPGRRAALLEAIEDSTDAADALLDSWGVDYEMPGMAWVPT